MNRRNSYITVTDQFCGAGGSSQGAVAAGLEVKMALNHWRQAIETYQTNFANTRVDCTDISACDPRRYPSTNILITSPECTTHSPGGGNTHKQVKAQLALYDSGKIDPATERSRATMWDVCRFTEYHNYDIVIVENVVEAKTRWPLFNSWLQCFHVLGYNHRCLYLNSMHFEPTPQSRDRMYVVFWKKGNKAPDLDYKPKAYCPKCAKDIHAIQSWKAADKKYGKFDRSYIYCCPTCSTKVQPYYHAAFNCIDWSDIGTRIGDRTKALSPNTERRIKFGIDKYTGYPLIFHTSYSGENNGTARNAMMPHFTQTGQQNQAIVNQPFIINNQHSTGVDFRVKSAAGDHLPSVTTEAGVSVVMPFIIKGENTGQMNVSSSGSVLQTQCTRQTAAVVTPPAFIVENKGKSNAREVTEAIATQTTVPSCGVVTSEAWNSFVHYNYNGSTCLNHFTERLGTVTAKDRAAVISYKKPNYEDCYYRMLKPHEIKLAMAFGRDYVVTGSGKDQVRQLGNAVTPPAMEWIIRQCTNSLK